MNIFQTYESILGMSDGKELNDALQEFFRLAAEIEVKLDGKGYLLDKYLCDLLAASNEILSHEAGDEGFCDSATLRGICTDVVKGGDRHKDHPVYKKAKAYLTANPLPFQETQTKSNILLTMMTGEFLESAMKEGYDKQEYALTGVFDIAQLTDIYREITDILGSEAPMKKLNLVIRQRFFIVPTMVSYLQGITNDLLYALNYRDIETGKQIFQLVMERRLPVTKRGDRDA